MPEGIDLSLSGLYCLSLLGGFETTWARDWRRFKPIIMFACTLRSTCHMAVGAVCLSPDASTKTRAATCGPLRVRQGPLPAQQSGEGIRASRLRIVPFCVIEGQACQECACAPARLNPEMALLCAHFKEKIVVRLGRLSQTVESAEGESTVLVDPSSTVSRVGD
jgi:hypothetical protein